ncbi:hypothetical protein C1I98_39100, partial [Spongiactinospora gelatinilytica]
RERALLWAAGVGLVLHVVVLALFGLVTVSAPKGDTPAAMADPVQAAVSRLVGWAAMTPTYFAVSVVSAFLLGMWAARRRVLEEPGAHRALLATTATAGTVVSLAGAVPLMLIDTRLWAPSEAVSISAYVLHSLTGMAGGLAYAALAGLLADRLKRGPVVRALVACGQWSLTCYLLQSVVFVAVFTPYLGGLATRVGDAAASGLAVLTWLGTVLLAATLSRHGRRGPAEAALRHLTYGRSH